MLQYHMLSKKRTLRRQFMQVLKIILTIVHIILALGVVVLVMLQHKEDQGMSATITGGSANNFLDKNKGRTREGKLKRMTIICAIAFTVLTIIFNIVYPLA